MEAHSNPMGSFKAVNLAFLFYPPGRQSPLKKSSEPLEIVAGPLRIHFSILSREYQTDFFV